MNTSINKQIIDMLKPLGYPIEFMTYNGSQSSYFVFNYADERGVMFADNLAQFELVSLQIHFFCPRTFNHINLKKQVKQTLINNDWVHPVTQTLYEREDDYYHLIFETEKEFYYG